MDELELKRNRLHEYLSRQGLRSTPQREVILEVFLRRHEHMTIEGLWDRVRKIDPSIGYATVYRTLRLFTECGIANKHEFGDKSSRYEGMTEQHHDHLICIRCGNIIEFENETIEKLQETISKDHSFQMVSHKMELYGYCRKCQKR